jgi:hypothetical protein
MSGDTLGTPYIALGIPVPDCNLLTPDATWGMPVPPWTQGGTIQTHVWGLPLLHPSYDGSYPNTGFGANRYGVGRSIAIDFQTDMDGGGASYIRTGPTPFGWVPSYGASGAFGRPSLLLIHNCDLQSGQVITCNLKQHGANGAFLQTDLIGTITDADNTSGEWQSVSVPAPVGDITLLSACAYFRIEFLINTNASALGIWGLDFVSLCFTPGIVSIWGGFDEFEEDYVGVNLRGPYHKSVRISKGLHSAQHFITQMDRGAQYVQAFQVEFIRAAAAWRDALNYYWNVQHGPISDNDNLPSDLYKLGGKPWPLVLRPRRPDFKQAMYCRMLSPVESLEIDNAAQYVETDPVFTGVAAFAEVDYS